MSTDFAMEMALLLLTNAVDGFLTAELRTEELSTVLNPLRENGILASAHVSSERERQQDVDAAENILQVVKRSPSTGSRGISMRLVSVFDREAYGES
jgi:hypothetical protein